ncbi:hypothetical protein V7068_11040, partial [Bacillus sp. JJ634]
MSSTYFFSNIEVNESNESFLTKLEQYAEEKSIPTYIIQSPLAEKKYTYSFSSGMIVLIPNHQIIIVNNNGEVDEFDDYHEDFYEDLGHLADRYEYKKILGRPRKWKTDLLATIDIPDIEMEIEEFLEDFEVED